MASRKTYTVTVEKLEDVIPLLQGMKAEAWVSWIRLKARPSANKTGERGPPARDLVVHGSAGANHPGANPTTA